VEKKTFKPSYEKVINICEALDILVPMLFLSATLTAQKLNLLKESFSLDAPYVFHKRKFIHQGQKEEKLVVMIASESKRLKNEPCFILVNTVKAADSIYDKLQELIIEDWTHSDFTIHDIIGERKSTGSKENR